MVDRRPVVMDQYSIHRSRMAFARSVNSWLGLEPWATTVTIPGIEGLLRLIRRRCARALGCDHVIDRYFQSIAF